MRAILDLEANGLLNDTEKSKAATTLHCAVFKDIDSGEMNEYIGWSEDLKEFLDNCTMICAHNGIDFDLPLLKKLYKWEPSEEVEIVDTLVMSRLLNPDRSPVEGTRAPHSVEAWGKRLGRWKPDHEDWSVFSPEMLHRCKEDVEIQTLIYKMLLDEADCKLEGSIFDKDNYYGHNWSESMYLEHESAKIIHEQSQNGCYCEEEKAQGYTEVLTEVIDEITDRIVSGISSTPKQKGVSIAEPFKKNGDYKKTVVDWFSEEVEKVNGPFSRIEWNTINLDSSVQQKKWLDSIGWKPDAWNFSKTEFDQEGKPLRTSPKITDTSLSKLGDIGHDLILRSKASHRRSQIEGFIRNTRDDHRIPAEANSLGTPTGRMTHRKVANIPSANVYENKEDKNDPRKGSLVWYPEKQKVFFGTEMRSLFSAEPGKVLVGRDASGLELRCFAHYINDAAYTDVILNGDIHTYNQEMAGLDHRSQAKTFIYAFLYGAGDAKIGSIVMPEGTESQRRTIGKEMKARFLAANPNLKSLIKNVRAASRRGYLVGIDGRKLIMRTNERGVAENKALNTLLQGAGAQVMTYARVWLRQEIINRGLNDKCLKVLDYHDEETYECIPEIGEELKELMIESVVISGKHFNFNIPLDADARIGNNWAQIH